MNQKVTTYFAAVDPRQHLLSRVGLSNLKVEQKTCCAIKHVLSKVIRAAHEEADPYQKEARAGLFLHFTGCSRGTLFSKNEVEIL
jgi:hypothetical protein